MSDCCDIVPWCGHEANLSLCANGQPMCRGCLADGACLLREEDDA